MSFNRLDPNDFVVSIDSITGICWSNGSPTLSSFYTSSTQAASSTGNYFLNVYDSASLENIQFGIAYGNKFGSGSADYDSLVPGNSYTKTIYGQFRNLVLGDENSDFSFGGVTGSDFYAISVERADYKESLFPGSMNLTLYSGSSKIQLTDNSNDVTTVTYLDAGRVYQVVSGSNGNANTTNPLGALQNGYTISGSYGLFLPDIGIVLLNAKALDLPFASGGLSLGTNRSSNSGTGVNNALLYSRIVSGSGTTGSFALNSQETITSDYVFVRARNAEYNYSENPSFISGSTGEVLYSSFINNPETYITTVGLYNDSNDLLAVAKLSVPLKKNFTSELLVKVKLDF
jgi:hypothetical protein